MHKFCILIVVGLFAIATGCRSTSSNATFFHAGGWENANDAKSDLDQYKNVFVACIYEDHWEDRGTHELSPHHFKVMVVRTYKGDWNVSERGAFVNYVDTPALTTSNEIAGQLIFVLTNEHTNAEVFLDAGECGNYDAGLDRALQSVYPHN